MAARRWVLLSGPNTRAACVVGWPIKHSRSPLIHGYWIRQHGLDADYRREAIAPEAFADFIRSLSSRGYVGSQHHHSAQGNGGELSEPDDCARAVGAANTLWLDGGRLRSTNTDVEGFTANLDDAVPGWRSGPARLCCSAPEARRVRWSMG